MNQMYTSANTSVNSSKKPKIYNLISIPCNANVIDFGCGKYFDNYKFDFNCVGYDPYNRPDEDVLNKTYEFAVCSNVLNVISEIEQRLNVLRKLKDLAPTVYITVYEGNKSGNGKVSKTDCYQLNRRACDYIQEIVSVFGKGNVRWNRKGFFECNSNNENNIVT